MLLKIIYIHNLQILLLPYINYYQQFFLITFIPFFKCGFPNIKPPFVQSTIKLFSTSGFKSSIVKYIELSSIHGISNNIVVAESIVTTVATTFTKYGDIGDHTKIYK